MLLKNGSSGTQVRCLQHGLHILCCSPKSFDGKFGDTTEEAVKKYQEKYNLTADGVVGYATWFKIQNLIKEIQTALLSKGYAIGEADGIAGSATYEGVVAFQEDNGLTADGMVGSSTLALLGLSGANSGSGTTSSTLKLGSNGSLTKYLQRLLAALGYTISIDGYFGTATETVVKSFQEKYSLEADGVVGGGTWSKIFSLYKVNASGTGAEKMVNIAKHELTWGFKEDNANNITPYGQWYGMNYTAWCAMFVSWCAHQAGIMGTKVPQFAYCPTGVSWYRDKGKYHFRDSNYTPHIGDTVFFFSTSLGRVSHTGILISATATTITTIEGNTSDGVYSKTYNRTNTYIDGYGCNDGPLATTEANTATAAINQAVLDKGVELLRACHNTVSYNDSTKKYTVTNAIDAVNFELGVECPYQVLPNVYITAKVAKEYTLYNNFSSVFATNAVNIFELDVVNGDIMYGASSVKEEMRVCLGGLSATEVADYVNIFESLALELEDGSMKIGFEFSKDINNSYLTIAYTVKHALERFASNNEMSFTYAITVRISDEDRESWQPALVKIENFVTYCKENPDEVILFGAVLGLLFIVVFGSCGAAAPAVPAIATAISKWVFSR